MKAKHKILSGILAIFAVTFSGSAAAGPVILMGIDAEDGGPGGHGPITVYENVVTNLLNGVTNMGSGVLVIGAGKATDLGSGVTALIMQLSFCKFGHP